MRIHFKKIQGTTELPLAPPYRICRANAFFTNQDADILIFTKPYHYRPQQ